jgi:hypothetical protein
MARHMTTGWPGTLVPRLCHSRGRQAWGRQARYSIRCPAPTGGGEYRAPVPARWCVLVPLGNENAACRYEGGDSAR